MKGVIISARIVLSGTDSPIIYYVRRKKKRTFSPTFSSLCLVEHNFIFPSYRRCLKNTQLAFQNKMIIKKKNTYIPTSEVPANIWVFSRTRQVRNGGKFRRNLHFKINNKLPREWWMHWICFIFRILPTYWTEHSWNIFLKTKRKVKV